VLADMAMSAKDAMLIDDNIGNIDRAKKLGLIGVHFTDFGSVKDSVESIRSQNCRFIPTWRDDRVVKPHKIVR